MPTDRPSEVREVPSYAALAARIFRPRRTRLLECVQRLTGAPEEVCRRSIVTGRGDPLLFFTQGWQTSLGPQSFARPSGAEAWEMLAPSGWMGEPRRGFGSSFTDALETPPDVRTALALCADPCGVATAESLAREAIARLARRGCVVADRVIWRVLEPMIFRPRFSRGSGPNEICGRDLYDSLTGVSPTPGGLRLKYQRARRDASLAAALEAARRASAPVRNETVRVGPCADDVADMVEWEVLARLQNLAESPFAPLVALWETGYGIDQIASGGITLVGSWVTRATQGEE